MPRLELVPHLVWPSHCASPPTSGHAGNAAGSLFTTTRAGFKTRSAQPGGKKDSFFSISFPMQATASAADSNGSSPAADAALGDPGAVAAAARACPSCGGRLGLKLSRRGAFVGCSGFPDCGYSRPVGALEGAEDQTAAAASPLFAAGAPLSSAPPAAHGPYPHKASLRRHGSLGQDAAPTAAREASFVLHWRASSGWGRSWLQLVVRGSLLRRSSGGASFLQNIFLSYIYQNLGFSLGIVTEAWITRQIARWLI